MFGERTNAILVAPITSEEIMNPSIFCTLWFMEKEWKQLFCIHFIWEEIIKSSIFCPSFNCLYDIWSVSDFTITWVSGRGSTFRCDCKAVPWDCKGNLAQFCCHELTYGWWVIANLVELQKLEGMQWTIHQVEMDLKPHHDHAAVWKPFFLVDHVWYLNAVDVIM